MIHTITLWIIGIMFVLNSVGTVLLIGKKREPLTPGMAAAIVFINMLLLIGLVL